MKTQEINPYTHLFISFLRLGLTAFGGPAMIAYIRKLSVNRNKWLDEETFKDGVSLCQSIPGATAMQMAAYVGLRSNGLIGALLSYVGFGLPAFTLMLILSIAYVDAHKLPQVISLFKGLQIIVVAIIANATYSFGKGILKNYREILIALISAALLWLGVSPFVIIIGAALAGTLFFMNPGSPALPTHIGKRNQREFKQVMLLFFIFIAGLAGLYIADIKLFKLATLMLKIDLFAFGGGFGSVPLMLHEIVDIRKWIDSKTFMDGIALGQVTPGPIVITATFVGYLMYRFAGALVATMAIFTPSFLILVGITPFFDRLKTSKYFVGATKGILATFVGLLFYATIKFAFAVPWEVVRVLLALGALTALIKKIDILYVVLVGAVISIIIL
ncbi:MAG: transporter [Nitrospirae bacterium CG_4_10_14_0_8_um_filter_41_23]|nr:chromate efflux transporter [Nitrospirota bacterium]PIQ93058.1 MAG: transporter [Nitrospirae bacterium CG11_big_fil_rev_8_21_14_0_20_41_14]PIV43983.1 MAG: transporter [Nitrospirae bacterium CG02_land_8_20_14_3_00_41_53]PIW86728.1 MAG: transporter [Nitrospirae bacterium CG_4_8_14_3_um_filter_41_47]PIY86751.1 MAG: transporter [Nitrospirae bacterium CG_4_10_14_0_8_um_filter_41_23]PJA80773.1 MAG: transporter [Nitrospirae bacterium CG_4_9_14_3_um_filter_41_27]